MTVIGINEIVALNKLLNNLGATVHVRDACGGQSFYIEYKSNECDCYKIKRSITDYFKDRNFNITFSSTNKEFYPS